MTLDFLHIRLLKLEVVLYYIFVDLLCCVALLVILHYVFC